MNKPTPALPGRGQRSQALSRVLAALRERFPARFLIGVSGGADSVALLDTLVRLGHRPHICHLNHKLRGAASDADAKFVRQLAGKYGLPVTVKTQRVAADENACRRARLAFFEQVARKTGIKSLALAHTADDQVETFLMRLIRGAGVDGLAGIWPERRLGKLRVIRPLLPVSRAQVLEYLNTAGLEWREDASNADRRFLRNRVRHELLPLLERDYNPKIRDALRRTAEILRAEAAGDPVAVERRAIREMSFREIEELRKLARKEDVPLPVAGRWKLKVPGATLIRELGVRFVVGTGTGRGGDAVPTEEVFDADAIGEDLTVRTWREGDRFQPLGMKGAKKLQDLFVDAKVPRRQRGRVPLLCASDGRIAWVVGYRMSDGFMVTEATKRVLRIRFQGC